MRQGRVWGVAHWVSGCGSGPMGRAVGGVAAHNLPTGEWRGWRQRIIVGIGGGYSVGLCIVAIFPAKYIPVNYIMLFICILLYFPENVNQNILNSSLQSYHKVHIHLNFIINKQSFNCKQLSSQLF